MPVTIKPISHGASTLPSTRTTQDLTSLLRQARTEHSQECEQIDRFCFTNADLDSKFCFSANGFVSTAIEAYDKHYHLTIRPEDVWFAILSQLSIWINANAEDARGIFFAHEGKKDLTVGLQQGNDNGEFAEQMTREIEKNVTDPELREWIMPAFTTTTATDAVVATILIMGDLPKRVQFIGCSERGIPSVTLLGELSDWEELHTKLDKLETFGTEPAQFGCLLKPVTSRFIESFHDPTSKNVVQFWDRMVSDECSDSGKYDGWISAFCFWGEQGENLNDRHIQFRGGRGYNLDGMVYHTIESDEIAPGYAYLPVKVNDDGNEVATMIVAGSLGTKYTSSDGASAGSDAGLDSVNPVSCWGMFVKKEGADETAKASEAGPGNSADESEPTISTSNEQAFALPEDIPSPVAATSGKKPGLMSRLANLFSRTDISK